MKKHFSLALLLAWLPTAYADLDALRAAAQTGDANAQLELGQLYEFGFGLKESAVPAMAWYLAASRTGNARATQRAAALKNKLSAAQEQEAERLSHQWAPATQPATTPSAPAPATTIAPPPPSRPANQGPAETPAPAPNAPASMPERPAAPETPAEDDDKLGPG